MKKTEPLRELPKRDTETQSEQMLVEKDTDRLSGYNTATSLCFVKTEQNKKTKHSYLQRAINRCTIK